MHPSRLSLTWKDEHTEQAHDNHTDCDDGSHVARRPLHHLLVEVKSPEFVLASNSEPSEGSSEKKEQYPNPNDYETAKRTVLDLHTLFVLIRTG